MRATLDIFVAATRSISLKYARLYLPSHHLLVTKALPTACTFTAIRRRTYYKTTASVNSEGVCEQRAQKTVDQSHLNCVHGKQGTLSGGPPQKSIKLPPGAAMTQSLTKGGTHHDSFDDAAPQASALSSREPLDLRRRLPLPSALGDLGLGERRARDARQQEGGGLDDDAPDGLRQEAALVARLFRAPPRRRLQRHQAGVRLHPPRARVGVGAQREHEKHAAGQESARGRLHRPRGLVVRPQVLAEEAAGPRSEGRLDPTRGDMDEAPERRHDATSAQGSIAAGKGRRERR